jgi:hypothetical protein
MNSETVGEAAARIYPNNTVDYALPQDFHNSMPATLHGQIVWLYTPASAFGLPAPLSKIASNWLAAQGALDASVVDAMHSDLEG